jgi:hypothetical protein
MEEVGGFQCRNDLPWILDWERATVGHSGSGIGCHPMKGNTSLDDVREDTVGTRSLQYGLVRALPN